MAATRSDTANVTFTDKSGRIVPGRVIVCRGKQALVLVEPKWHQASNTWRGKAFWVVPFADLRQ